MKVWIVLYCIVLYKAVYAHKYLDEVVRNNLHGRDFPEIII